MLRLFTGDRGGSIMLALLGIGCVVVPVFNLLVPESSWLHLSTYTVTLWGKYLTYALLAMGAIKTDGCFKTKRLA
jgi:urea transport system permease protein